MIIGLNGNRVYWLWNLVGIGLVGCRGGIEICNLESRFRVKVLRKNKMGFPAATGGGTSRTDATRARDLAPMAFRCRNSSGILRRQKAVGSSSRSTGMGRLFLYTRRAWRSGEKRGGGAAASKARGGVR
jgi:hypothetical protein